jgi:hypothetical protein
VRYHIIRGALEIRRQEAEEEIGIQTHVTKKKSAQTGIRTGPEI